MKTIAEMKKNISEAEKKAEMNPDTKPNAKTTAKPEKKEVPAETQELAAQIEAAETLNKDLTDKYQRALAEYDNFRKRTIKEKASAYDDGASDILKLLLPVIDSFERALTSVPETERESSAYTGMSLIYKQVLQFMESAEMAEIEALGKKFDPEIHQALAHADDPGLGENEVAGVLQKGYKFKDRIIRHSMVNVAN